MGSPQIPRGVELAIAAIALIALTGGPAWAGEVLPGPAAGGLVAGGAIIGALVVAKWWRRR